MNKNYTLTELGLNEKIINEFNDNFNKGQHYLGRVSIQYKNLYVVETEQGSVHGKINGKMFYNAEGKDDFPAVGDWVVLDRNNEANGEAVIQHIITRKSKFSRKEAGDNFQSQIVAANIDILFICMSLNNNFNLRRMERYISVAWDSGAVPVIVLTKADLCHDYDTNVSNVRRSAIGIDVVVTSNVENLGVEKIKSYMKTGITAAFIGSSGVGKSTLINNLCGKEMLDTGNIGENDKGRHTTTHREMVVLPEGGVVIDTPGMRELHVLDNETGIENSFSDIDELSKKCKFSNCQHETEPGCAVREAIDKGEITLERYLNYVKLQKEAEFMKRKLDKREADKYKKHIIKRNKSIRKVKY
ncbi:ribosome small subunit-dependent GTPase A [Clostridium sp. JN-9]|uniref:ribosome small subunit-dependent GTPase A n=1 Tax=Clostridium sp. JN-9 TaxID=2507159 RepID=UPI000FFE0666|nr:ribosome small subunit-dependent GTPase A [Clostridium sp. JN-9]QAT40470.1 ribosome small subunit-dependent GTPase A [Clostridium sp. JN-9]